MNLGNTEKSLLKEIAGLEAIPAGLITSAKTENSPGETSPRT